MTTGYLGLLLPCTLLVLLRLRPHDSLTLSSRLHLKGTKMTTTVLRPIIHDERLMGRGLERRAQRPRRLHSSIKSSARIRLLKIRTKVTKLDRGIDDMHRKELKEASRWKSDLAVPGGAFHRRIRIRLTIFNSCS